MIPEMCRKNYSHDKETDNRQLNCQPEIKWYWLRSIEEIIRIRAAVCDD